jgi:uncharacterized protein (UPF0262 family)
MANDICSLKVDTSLMLRSDESGRARARIITDILKESKISLKEEEPPYHLHVKLMENRLVLTFNDLIEHSIGLSSLRKLMKDYHIVCESYHEAIQAANTSKVEAIDMGRRGLHNEGAEKIMDLCALCHILLDLETARKFFTLVYLLHY